MAFLYTFTGLTVGSMAWMAIWVGCSESSYGVLNVVAEWLSPMTVTGWIAFVVLSVLCSWITYRLMKSIYPSHNYGTTSLSAAHSAPFSRRPASCKKRAQRRENRISQYVGLAQALLKRIDCFQAQVDSNLRSPGAKAERPLMV